MNEIKSKRQAAQILGKVVASYNFEVRDALFQSGVDISPTASERQVIERLIENIGRNTMLQEKIGQLSTNIVGNNSETYKNSAGGAGQQGFFQNSQNQQAIGNVLGQALGFWLGSRRERQQAELQTGLLTQQQTLTQANADLVQQQLELERLRGSQQAPPQGMSKGVKIAIISIVALALVGGIIFFVRKKK
jgi:hypothetical protein